MDRKDTKQLIQLVSMQESNPRRANDETFAKDTCSNSNIRIRLKL